MQVDSRNFVKKETMYLVALGAVIAGFLAGVVFSAFQRSDLPVAGAPPQQQQQAGGSGFSPEQADRILMLEREVATNPNNAEAWTQLGNIWYDSGKADKAIEAYQKSLAINPGNADVLTDMGVMYRSSNQPQKAVEAFDKAIAADPKHKISRFNKGIVLIFDIKDLEAGLKAWEELVAIYPDAAAPDGKLISQMISEFRAKAAAAAPK